MRLLDIRQKDYQAILKLTRKKDVMKYVLDGKVWSEEKVSKFIKYNLEEQKMDNKERKQFFYRMVKGEEFIGIIGFYIQRDVYHLRVFLLPEEQGKGYFNQALEILKEKLKRIKKVDKLYSEVHTANHRMISIMSRKYYFAKSFLISKIPVNQYIIYLRPYVYLVKSDYFSPKMVKSVFSRRQNWVSSDVYPYMKNPDFLHLDGEHYYDRKNWKYRVVLKNLVNDGKDKIINKGRLVYALKNKSYILETRFFEPKKDAFAKFKHAFDNGNIRILKPEGRNAYAGKDIQVFSSFEDFEKIKNAKKYDRWSMQTYLKNPNLILGRKYHLRVLFLYRGDHKGFWFRKIPIYLAKKSFGLSNFDDDDVHVSHYSEKDPPRYFPSAVDITEKQAIEVYRQLQVILKDVMQIFRAGCYKESDHCYEIFGADLMLDENFKLYLLEINNKIGLKEFTDDPYAFNEELLEAELRVTCDEYFPPATEIKEKDHSVDEGVFVAV